MEMLTEEMNRNSPPPWSTQACTQPQVMASHGERGGGGNWDGAAEQVPGGQSPVGPDVPRQSLPSPRAGAPSQGPAPHSPGCSSSACPGWLETLREPEQGAVGGTELPGPHTVEWDLAGEETEWEPYLGQWELFQQGQKSAQELSQRDYEKYQDLSQLEFERDQELSHGEDVTRQEPSQKQDVSARELCKQDDKRDQELSEGEIDPELIHQEFERQQELSKWLDMRIQELFQSKSNSNKMFPQWEHSIYQELSEGEVRQYPKLSDERGDSDKKESQEDLECVIIHTIWINPKYPQLLQDPDAAPQDSAMAAASPALAGQVKAAGAQSQGPAPHSPCCPPGPSAPQPGAQALREQPAPPQKRPSRFRRALRALRALLCWPCRRARPDNRCPLPAPGWAPQVTAGFDVQVSGTSVPCQENGLAED